MNRPCSLARCSAALTPTVAVVLLACSINPATGNRQLNLVSEPEEIELGRQSDEEIVASLGLYDDPELQAYVQQLGQRLAAASERPHLPWSFRVVDDPVVNAFALPGGYIYITRGILTHLGSEAQLVGVLGHEIGHVTARHGVNQMSKALLAQMSLSVGVAVVPEAAAIGDLAEIGLGLLFLKYGRDDERQADDLGVRYAVRTAYDPDAMNEVFAVLDRVGEQQGGGGIPSWLSTHPHPENRAARISGQIASLEPSQQQGNELREPYLRRLEGVVFGDDPRQGFFVDGQFLHPGLEFRLQFPNGWKTVNSRQAVTAVSPKEDAVLQITLSEEPSLQAAENRFFSQDGVSRGAVWRPQMDGLPVVGRAFEVSGDDTDLFGLVAFVEHQGKVFQLVGYCRMGDWTSYGPTFDTALGGFRRLRDPKILGIEPMRLRLVELPTAMTLEMFAQSYPSSVSLDTLALINQREPGEMVPGGSLLKQVVGFNPATAAESLGPQVRQ